MVLHFRLKMALLCTVSKGDDCVWNVSWNPFGTEIATCGGNKAVHLWTFTGKNTPYIAQWERVALSTELL